MSPNDDRPLNFWIRNHDSESPQYARTIVMLQISPRGSAWVTSDLMVTLLEPTSSGSLTRRPAPVGKDPGNHTTPGPGQGGTDGTAAPACPPLSQLSRAPARPLSLGGTRVRRSPGGVSVWSPLQCDGQTRLGGRPHVSPGPEARSPAVASDTSARVCETSLGR